MPPQPASLPFTIRRPNRNHDFPPAIPPTTAGATRDQTSHTVTASQVSSRLQHLRDLVSSPRRQEENAHSEPENPSGGLTTAPLMSSPADHLRRSRGRIRRFSEHVRDQQPRDSSGSDLSSSTTSALTPQARPRARPSGRFSHLFDEQRMRRLEHVSSEQLHSTSDDLAELRAAGERLAQVNEDLRHLLERPIGERSSSDVPRDPSCEDQSENRRKRRRIEAPSKEDDFPRIEYGFHGQVVAGRLNMEVLSADGGLQGFGTHSHGSSLLHPVENILKNDKTYYDSKSPRCNMVLRHPGDVNFTVDKLVIQGHGGCVMDSHTLEGLVFISNRKDALFDRTARHEIFHLPTSRLGRGSSQHQSGSHPQQNQTGAARNESSYRSHARLYHTFRAPEELEPAAGTSDSDHQTSSPLDTQNPYIRQYPPMVPQNRSSHTSDSLRDLWNQFQPREAEGEQFDFEELLRRGSSTTADRRRRRYAARRRARHRAMYEQQERLQTQLVDHQENGTLSESADDVYDATISALDESLHNFQNAAPLMRNDEPDGPPTEYALNQEDSPSDGTPQPAPINMEADGGEYLTSAAHFSLPTTHRTRLNVRESTGDHSSDTSESPDFQVRSVAFPEGNHTKQCRGHDHISIHFDPPLTGRYLLLKLWTRQGAGPPRNSRCPHSTNSTHLHEEDPTRNLAYPRPPNTQGTSRDSSGDSAPLVEEVEGVTASNAQLLRDVARMMPMARDNDGVYRMNDIYEVAGPAGLLAGNDEDEKSEEEDGDNSYRRVGSANVELMRVMVEGWAGPRFFPAVEMR
ncbi:MAG: hypothetical protein M1831_006063 [Alyxoria varia]|nr:MAG: hypothetical protein M1831_006063 [Alyxoria varia]